MLEKTKWLVIQLNKNWHVNGWNKRLKWRTIDLNLRSSHLTIWLLLTVQYSIKLQYFCPQGPSCNMFCLNKRAPIHLSAYKRSQSSPVYKIISSYDTELLHINRLKLVATVRPGPIHRHLPDVRVPAVLVHG